MTEGRKFDEGKAPLDLLPFDALEGVGVVLAYGVKKYARHNWAFGMAWGRLAAAALRHLGRWLCGEERDAESGLPHLDHFACCALMLSALVKRGVGEDDRHRPSPQLSPGQSGRARAVAACLARIPDDDGGVPDPDHMEPKPLDPVLIFPPGKETPVSPPPPPEISRAGMEADDAQVCPRCGGSGFDPEHHGACGECMEGNQ